MAWFHMTATYLMRCTAFNLIWPPLNHDHCSFAHSPRVSHRTNPSRTSPSSNLIFVFLSSPSQSVSHAYLICRIKANYARLSDDASELVNVIYYMHPDIGREEDVDAVLKANLDDVLK
jgi:hypothetical protein